MKQHKYLCNLSSLWAIVVVFTGSWQSAECVWWTESTAQSSDWAQEDAGVIGQRRGSPRQQVRPHTASPRQECSSEGRPAETADNEMNHLAGRRRVVWREQLEWRRRGGWESLLEHEEYVGAQRGKALLRPGETGETTSRVEHMAGWE